MARLMNEENDQDHHTSCGVKEGPADGFSFRPWEVTTALEMIEQQKAPGLSGVITEMLQVQVNLELNG